MRRHILSATVLLGTLTGASLADDAAYRAGVGLLNKGMHDLAAPEFRRYLDENPEGTDAARARYCLGLCLAHQGKHREAAELLQAVADLKDFEFAVDASLLLAQSQAAQGDEAGAISRLTRLTKVAPKFASLDRAYQLLGEIHYRSGDFGRSRAASQEVLNSWPASEVVPRAQLFAAMAAMAQGEVREAAEAAAALRTREGAGELSFSAALVEAQCRLALGDTATALERFESATEAKDARVRAEALLGAAQAARGAHRPEVAQRALDRLTGEDHSGEMSARASLERGRLALEQGRTEDASKAFKDAQAAPGLEDDAAYWSAKCDLKSDRFAEAARRLESAIATFPESELKDVMAFDRAWALTRAGNDAAAAQAWRQWREDFRGHALEAEAIAAQAGCVHRQGRYGDSLKLCEEFRNVAGDSGRTADVDLLRAENLYALERYEFAEEAFAGFLDSHPDHDESWRAGVRRGLALARLKKTAEAVSILTRAVGAPGGDSGLRAMALSALGEAAFQQERWTEASKWFSEIAAQAGETSARNDAQLRLGIALGRAGDHKRAEDALKAIASGNTPVSLHARFELGQVLMEMNRLDEARAVFEEVLRTEAAGSSRPFSLHARRHLAAIASRQGRAEDAAGLLGEVASEGDSPDALIEQGSAYLAAGKFDLAERAFNTYLEREPRSSRSSEVLAQRAIAVGRQGRHAEAVRQMDAIPNPKDFGPALAATLRYERALNLRELTRTEDAAAAFRECLANEAPARLEAYAALELAQLESEAQHDDLVMQLLARCDAAAERAGRESMGDVVARSAYLRGVCLLRQGKAQQAAAALEPVATAGDDRALASAAALVRGEALLKSGRANDACAVLAALAESAAPDELVSAALLRLGEAAAASQQWSRSEQVFTRFLDRFTDSALEYQARFGLGWAQENQGRHDAAIASYQQVTAGHQGPTAARAQFQIGECLFAQKKLEQAAAELLKVDVLYAYPEWSAAALYEAGRCLADLGRAEEGAKQHDDLIARFPDSQWAKMAKERRAAQKPAALPGRGATRPHESRKEQPR